MAQQVMNEIRSLPEAGSVTSNRSLPRQELSITPNRTAMADQGPPHKVSLILTCGYSRRL